MVDLFVIEAVFGDVGVRTAHRLRLVIVVVGVKYSTALFGRNSRRSLQSWAASVFVMGEKPELAARALDHIGDRKVLPVPVAPNKVLESARRTIQLPW